MNGFEFAVKLLMLLSELRLYATDKNTGVEKYVVIDEDNSYSEDYLDIFFFDYAVEA